MPDAENTNQVLEAFRGYLETLTAIQVAPRLRSKFGLSDIISQTLLEAYQMLDRIRRLQAHEILVRRRAAEILF